MSGEIVLQLHVNAKPVVWHRLLLLKKTSAWKRSAIPGQREYTMYLIEDNSNSYMVVYSVKFHLALIRTDARHILSSELSDLHTFRDKPLNRQQKTPLVYSPFQTEWEKTLKKTQWRQDSQNARIKKKNQRPDLQVCVWNTVHPSHVWLPSHPSLP